MIKELAKKLKSHHQSYYPFGVLVLAQICVLVIPAFEEFIGFGFLLRLTYSLVVISSLYIVTSSGREFTLGLLLSSFSILFIWVSYANTDKAIDIIHLFSTGAFFIYCATRLWQFLYAQKKFDVNTIFGAIAGYMFIGFICALVLSILDTLIPGSFKEAHLYGEFDMLYLSFVTITTLGYGDLVPAHPISRSFCVLFAIGGQVYLTVILAIIVGQFLQSKN